MKEYWVFGATKSVGKAITAKLSAGDHVVAFSRRSLGQLENVMEQILDFEDNYAVDRSIQAQLEKSIPDGIIFCQRYRPGTDDTLSNIIKGCTVELGPVISLVESLRKTGHTKPVAIVLLTSVAGKLVHVDIPLYYHILKANTFCINNYVSVHERDNNVRINCICLGEFLKYDITQYNETQLAKFDVLRDYSYNHEIVDMSQIINLITFLVSEESTAITGQVLFMDGNLSNIAQESILRVGIASK